MFVTNSHLNFDVTRCPKNNYGVSNWKMCLLQFNQTRWLIICACLSRSLSRLLFHSLVHFNVCRPNLWHGNRPFPMSWFEFLWWLLLHKRKKVISFTEKYSFPEIVDIFNILNFFDTRDSSHVLLPKRKSPRDSGLGFFTGKE